MGKEHENIVRETVTATNRTDTGSIITSATLKAARGFDKKLSTITRNLVERLLPYFITQDALHHIRLLRRGRGTEHLR